jgi:hypothetical protein
LAPESQASTELAIFVQIIFRFPDSVEGQKPIRYIMYWYRHKEKKAGIATGDTVDEKAKFIAHQTQITQDSLHDFARAKDIVDHSAKQLPSISVKGHRFAAAPVRAGRKPLGKRAERFYPSRRSGAS